jgi:hypothetical protein
LYQEKGGLDILTIVDSGLVKAWIFPGGSSRRFFIAMNKYMKKIALPFSSYQIKLGIWSKPLLSSLKVWK